MSGRSRSSVAFLPGWSGGHLKTGVDRPDLYDPQINRTYAELANDHRLMADPARAFKPKDKPKVERAMPYVRDSFFRGRTFTSLPQLQEAAVLWCRQVAGARTHRGLDGASPQSVFDTVEARALTPLPRNEFELTVWSRGNVGVDCHINIKGRLYSVPWWLIGQQVHVRTAGAHVQILPPEQGRGHPRVATQAGPGHRF